MSNKQGRSFVLPERLRGVQAIAYLSEVDYLLRGTNLVALQASKCRALQNDSPASRQMCVWH